MKKISSAFLCLCVLVGSMAALIPTASGAMVSKIPNAASVPSPKEKTELVYSEDFEDPSLDSSLMGSALMDALGWTGTLSDADLLTLTEEGDGTAVSITASSTRMDTVCLLQDDRLIGGDYILEYDVHLISNSNSDPERTFGFCSESATTFNTNKHTAWRLAMKENGTVEFSEDTGKQRLRLSRWLLLSGPRGGRCRFRCIRVSAERGHGSAVLRHLPRLFHRVDEKLGHRRKPSVFPYSQRNHRDDG